jgi:RNA polymerase sigma factor (TIGR02999 family)
MDETGGGVSKACRPELGLPLVQRKKGAGTDMDAPEVSATAWAMAAESLVRMNADPQITEILARHDSGALDVLLPKIYASLRRLAHRQRAHEAAHTLETTALVHEAYLALARKSEVAFVDRAHLFAYISRLMRHLLIDHARRKNAQKRQAPEMTAGRVEPAIIDVLAIDEALNRLSEVDQRLARVAELRLFADLSSPDIAEVVGVNARTIERDWLKARAFLSACLIPESQAMSVSAVRLR